MDEETRRALRALGSYPTTQETIRACQMIRRSGEPLIDLRRPFKIVLCIKTTLAI
jgi:hypothetical protein